MKELQIFTYGEIQIRTIQSDSETWWVLKDICKVLGLNTAQLKKVADRLDDDEKGRNQITTAGGIQETYIVNESGLYNVILRSDKPEAKPFRKWITSDVLPSIRKHGMYAADEILNNPDLLIGIAQKLKEERALRTKAERQIAHDKPKVFFADAVVASETSILVGDLAKLMKQNGVNIGQVRLFEWLRTHGFLIKRKGSERNMPTQRAMERGLFEIKESTIIHSGGHTSISKTPKVTGRGQVYFLNRFLQEKARIAVEAMAQG